MNLIKYWWRRYHPQVGDIWTDESKNQDPFDTHYYVDKTIIAIEGKYVKYRAQKYIIEIGGDRKPLYDDWEGSMGMGSLRLCQRLRPESLDNKVELIKFELKGN